MHAHEIRPADDWGREQNRQPVPHNDDVVIFSEPGRILTTRGGVDCRSHSFKLVTNTGFVFLLVRHGGGDERLQLGHNRRIVDALTPLDSDARYWLLHTFLDLHHKSEAAARTAESHRYKTAFIEGRLKKRKMPGQDAVKVWIEPTN